MWFLQCQLFLDIFLKQLVVFFLINLILLLLKSWLKIMSAGDE